MSNVKKAVLAYCLLGALLQGCSHTEPSVRDFTQVSQRQAKAVESGNTLEQAEAACKEETKTKGLASITAIFSRFRKGSADEDYIACMKQRGFEVQQ
jgi:hypothetical protein